MAMTPKEIGRAADRIFAAAIPHNWVIRDQQDQEDYGIDYEIEVMLPGDKPSGFLFKVQQKGAMEIEVDSGGEVLVYSKLKIERMRYYLRQIDMPTALVLVDVTKKCVWWAALQGNPIAETRFTAVEGTTNETMTMQVQKVNTLPGTEQQFVDAMRAAQDALTIRCVREATSPRVLTAALNTACLGDTVDAFRRHSDYLRLEQVEQFRRAGDLASALQVSERIWQSPSETLQLRFAAAVNIVRFAATQMLEVRTFDAQEAFLQRRMGLTNDLVALTEGEKGPEHLILYARLLHQCARLSFHVDRFMGFVQSAQVQPKGGMFTPIINAGKQHMMTMAFREFQKGQEVITEMIKKGHRHLVPQSWAWLVAEVGPFALLLRMDRQNEASNDLIRWIDDTASPVVELAAHARDWESVVLCAMELIGIGAGPNPPCPIAQRVVKAKELLGHIPDARIRKQHEARIEERATFLTQGRPKMTIDREQEMVRHMANAIGINLEDTEDLFAQIAQLGIADMNPERVLRNCRHFFVCTDTYGAVGEVLGLRTAGTKWLNCTKHGYGVGGMSLDGAYETFQQEYCSKCPDACPHPAEWQWSHEWQAEQDKLNLPLIEKRRNFGK